MSWFSREPSLPIKEPAIDPSSQAPEPGPVEDLERRLAAMRLPGAARQAARRELERLKRCDPAMAEYATGLSYLEFFLDIPWTRTTPDRLDLKQAKELLDAEHHGLEPVKERILEHLAAGILRGSRPFRVLVVDDEPIALDNMAHALRKEGHQVLTASDGSQALQLLAGEEFDLLISDLKMGQVSGMELLRQVRARHPGTEVMLVTGYATVDTAVEALLSGAVQFLAKPIDLEQLRRLVSECAARRSVSLGQGPVLCFAGPPGTGKTSVGKAVAAALGRKFVRFSVAGLRDEAELRGHRRTYVGAMPGRILSELRKLGVNNPVFMLDEIDKIGHDFRGDPASVLLETLDPQQNQAYLDHYLDLPFDLSKVMFIATANMVDSLPRPLLDRMEVITFPSYSRSEKVDIIRRFLAPRQMRLAGLAPDELHVSDQALERMVAEYSSEAGLRSIERLTGKLCRSVSLQVLTTGLKLPASIDADDLPGLLGPSPDPDRLRSRAPEVGVASGLVVGEMGGRVVFVETARMKGRGRLLTTGSMGRVLRESVVTALSHIRSHAPDYGVDLSLLEDADIHVHIPAAAVPKDGPSAGLTIAVALLSLLRGRPLARNLAMTGELSLTGRVMPVAGLRDKVLAAQQAGLEGVLLPAACAEDREALAREVGPDFPIRWVDTLAEAAQLAFETA